MRYEPLPSLEELLAPETLARLCREPIASVRCRPFTEGHSASGSSFLLVETNDGRGPRFVVKQSSPACDWIVRATADTFGREVLVWSSGLLDRLPPEIVHPVVACAHDDAAWAILMHDASDVLRPSLSRDLPIAQADHHRYLDALAALHAKFWGEDELADPAQGFCTPRSLYTSFSPETGRREASHSNEVVRWLREGWELFWSLAAPDVTDLLDQLFTNPDPLCTALARYPRTVAHGDPRGANLGITRQPEPRVMLIDWQFVGLGPPGVDVSWYVWSVGHRITVTREASFAYYRDRLAHRLGERFDGAWWQPQLELSLLGQLVRGGWDIAWDAAHHPSAAVRSWKHDDLAWWCQRAREGARWL